MAPLHLPSQCSSRHRRPGVRGFTIIELITTVVIVATLAVVGAPIMAGGVRVYVQGVETTRQDAAGKLAMERMLRELRHIRSPADLTTLTGTQITFTDIYGKSVTYSFSGGNLSRQEGGGTARVLASNVSSFAFTYLQNDGQTTTSTASKVYYIAMQMTIAVSGSNLGVNASYVGSVRLLNA